MMSRKKEKVRGGKGKMNWDLLPLMILFGILPWIVHLKTVEMPLTQYAWFPSQAEQYDFFLYWKGALFAVLALWMLLVLADRSILRRKRGFCWREFLPLLLYALLAVLSAVFSVNRGLSLTGIWEQFETVWVLLGYVAAAFYACSIVESRRDAAILAGALAAGAAVQAILGILQLAGADFFGSDIGKRLILGREGAHLLDYLSFEFSGSQTNRVYLASHNPNYAGVYLVLVLPVLFMASLAAKKTALKAGGMVLSGALLLCLFGSGSKTGLFVLLFLAAALIMMLFKKKRARICGIVCCAVCFTLTAAVWEVSGGYPLSETLEKTVKRVGSYKMEDVIPRQDCVELHYRERTVYLEAYGEAGEDGAFLARDEDGAHLKVKWKKKKQRWVIREPEFSDIGFQTFRQENGKAIVVYCNRSRFVFIKTGQEPYTYVNPYGKADTIKRAESMLFDGYEKAFSGRGYIWGRTLPVALRHLILGTGPDTFALVFPQSDYLMRANTGPEMYLQIVTKPHSMYLQTAVLTGGLSLLCLLVFWGSYIRLFWKTRKYDTGKDGADLLETGIFLSVCGYLLMGIWNDSSLAAAPVFWGLIGVGMALARQKERIL